MHFNLFLYSFNVLLIRNPDINVANAVRRKLLFFRIKFMQLDSSRMISFVQTILLETLSLEINFSRCVSGKYEFQLE